MNWTRNYRMIMKDIANERGESYEEAHHGLPSKQLFLIDKRLWWKRITGKLP